MRSSVGALLRRVSLVRSRSFRLTLHDLIRRTHWLRTDVAPFTLYRDWRDEQFDRFGLAELYGAFDEEFLREYPGKLDRIGIVLQVLQASLSAAGDIVEFGVFKGHTALALHAVLERSGSSKRLFLFDSFTGMPPSAHPLDRHWQPGDLTGDAQRIEWLFRDSTRVQVIPGFFSESLSRWPSLQFCFCHVDCDLFSSTMECLEYLHPRLSPGGAVVFDDFGFRRCAGARQAVEDFASRHSLSYLTLPTGQAVYFKS